MGVVVAALIVGYTLFAFLPVFPNRIESTSTPTPMPTPIPTSEPIITVDTMVFEGEKWMKIFDNGTVTGYSYHLYPDYRDVEIMEGTVSREEMDILLELFSNLADCEKYEVPITDELSERTGGCHIFDSFGHTTISCLPVNKTLKLDFLPPKIPTSKPITPTAEEILVRLDKIYQETKVVERIREMNPN